MAQRFVDVVREFVDSQPTEPPDRARVVMLLDVGRPRPFVGAGNDRKTAQPELSRGCNYQVARLNLVAKLTDSGPNRLKHIGMEESRSLYKRASSMASNRSL
jgi:hypothetical protein